MEKDKEIEKLRKIILKHDGDWICCGCGNFEGCRKAGKDDCSSFKFLAEHLFNEGYGDFKQAVKEFADELKKIFKTKHAAVMANVVNNQIDELFKERFCK